MEYGKIEVGPSNRMTTAVPRETRLHETLEKSGELLIARMEQVLTALSLKVEPAMRPSDPNMGGSTPGVTDAVASSSPLADIINNIHRRVHARLTDIEYITSRIEL